MKKRSLVGIILFTTLLAGAEEITIGGKKISLPAPEGYILVSEDMGAVYALQQQMVDPQNTLLGYYIPEAAVETALQGQLPSLDKTCMAKIGNSLVNASISQNDFATLKKISRAQNEEYVHQARDDMDKAMKKQRKGISREFDVDIALEVSQIVPLEPHYESDNAMSYSMYVNYGVTSAGVEQDSIVVVTTTFINISGKVLFLYVYAPREELEWTRETSGKWAVSVLSSNEHNVPSESRIKNRIAFKKVLLWAGVGGLAGLVYALIWLRRKKKKSST
ncbi:MAG: hypothetical protein JW874_12165 [Spirochaetales bacterium]|nr:hypothetical protein [Spirochaetales bacterium]